MAHQPNPALLQFALCLVQFLWEVRSVDVQLFLAAQIPYPWPNMLNQHSHGINIGPMEHVAYKHKILSHFKWPKELLRYFLGKLLCWVQK